MSENNEILELMTQYKDIDEKIDEYNQKIHSKALDLGVRILSDLVSNFNDDMGSVEITDRWGGCRRSEIILEIKPRGYSNGNFIKNDIKKYILERYPDAEPHCSGIILGRTIIKRDIERSIKNIRDKKDFGVCDDE